MIVLQGRDACQGDSGGALFAKRPLSDDPLPAMWRSQLIGIVSFGDKCGTIGKPGQLTFSRISIDSKET